MLSTRQLPSVYANSTLAVVGSYGFATYSVRDEISFLSTRSIKAYGKTSSVIVRTFYSVFDSEWHAFDVTLKRICII